MRDTGQEGATMAGDLRERLGRFGVWHRGIPPIEVVQGLERLGYAAVWLGGSPPGDLRAAEGALEASTSIVVATGVVNIWASGAHEVAQSFARVAERFGDRFVLGVGVGHPEGSSEYHAPYESLSTYVSTLLGEGVPQASLVLAALGPRVLELAGHRTGGAHSYLVTPQHTKQARGILGPPPVLVPEQKVVIDPDGDRARAVARKAIAPYLGLSNYTNNLRRLGWGDADFAHGGSDALVEALVAHGSVDEVAARLHDHLEAGADHVAVHMLPGNGESLLLGFEMLGAALGL